jgi:hypothetical protein
MTQSEYSAIAKQYILKNHPGFEGTINYEDDDSFECSIQSKKKQLSIWISTYDTEITIGFDEPNGKCDWHTHMSLYNAYEPWEEFEAMTELLQLILTDKKPILFSSKSGYTLPDEIEEDLKSKDTDEIMIVYKWSDL